MMQTAMAEVEKEIELAHVLLIDMVGYSKLLTSEQHRLLELLNRIVRGTEQFRRAEASERLITVPAGDGMALVFYNTPEAPVECALEISRAIREHPELDLRMGIHSGSVSGVTDVSGRANVAGAGINVAQRVMDCGDAGHILLSRRVAEDLEQYGHWRPYLHDLGECEVKHGVRLQIVNLYTGELGNPELPQKFKSSRRARWMTPVRIGIALALLLATIAASIYLTRIGKSWRRGSSAPTQEGQQRLISNFPGSHTDASFSPDGTRIAFVNTINGSAQVWLKTLAEGEPTPLTSGDEEADGPRWSPTGDEIVFTRVAKGASSIYSVPAGGGTPRKVIEGGRNANWSWDGGRLVFERGYEVWTAKRDGSDQRRVEGIPPTDLLLAPRMPAFSPDGSLIAFFQNDQGPIGDYWVIPSGGGTARRLTSDVIFGGAPVWMPDGQYLVFPSQRGGSLTLWRVARDGGEPEPVLRGAGEDTEPAIARDGGKLIYTNTRKRHTLMLTDAKTGESRAIRESRLQMVDPSFSPDGSRVAFFSVTETGDVHLFTINVDGSNLVQLTQGRGEQNTIPQWAADGKTIYFYQTLPTVSFRKIPVTGGKSIEVVPGWEWGTQNHAGVDPEEKRIVYTRMDRGLAAATMLREIQSGKETAFTLPLHHCQWSHDGKFIAGSYFPGGQWKQSEIQVCTVADNTCEKIASGYFPKWADDDSRLFYAAISDFVGTEVWSVSRDGTDSRKAAELQPITSVNNFFAVSQGRIVWVRFEQSKSELWLTEL